jgi:hypothetical protein
MHLGVEEKTMSLLNLMMTEKPPPLLSLPLLLPLLLLPLLTVVWQFTFSH